jgi:hypothetical protein
MQFEARVLREAGYEEAMLGLSLSWNQAVERMPDVARKLAGLDGGHNKFAESIQMWLDIRAPRYWWQQFDTYRVGVTKQSGSTMHTLMNRLLTDDDFARPLPQEIMDFLNDLISRRMFDDAKNALPEGFMQRRIVSLNYKTLRNIVQQRSGHKLQEWRGFVQAVRGQVGHPEFLE